VLLERTTYAVYCRDFRSIKCAGIAGWLAAIEHKCILSYVQMIIEISTSGPGLPMADGQKPMPVSVRPFRGA